MRLLILMLLLLFGYMPASAAGHDFPASTKDMLHLEVTATSVRLRAGPGTEFEVLGMATRGDSTCSRYIADPRPKMDSTGRPWFRLIGQVEQQTELGVYKLDTPCWIRSDFVKTRVLSEREALRADSTFFGILPVSLSSMPGVANFTAAKDIPVCATEHDCLFAEGAPVLNAVLPAGETFHFWSLPFKGSSGQVCIIVYKKTADDKAQKVGAMPRSVLDSVDFGKDADSVEAWKKRQPSNCWE